MKRDMTDIAFDTMLTVWWVVLAVCLGCMGVLCIFGTLWLICIVVAGGS